ncbi:putative bifunctional UDP-N-acetylglucosamine transferase and deubiquitinase ALG13 isoform X2 [Acanthaster planci]|uniref:Bifunctional UDP-N-acetylglucosamine transferase and deubiquitinase ALG13 isoform X2 n=1 Tax=Acanthaster planci TaxID=133434 RepID=A0A8B7ZY63_ACAPL|nr:putative bifunctional UDP-N-acetylglucosamine transferase and deubiquitinase ALG13 isoform X2 [Acanthaster planci]
MRRFQRIIEPIDDYLSSIGLYRKITAKDGSCLFRAVAEQVFHTQAHHLKVREACVQYMENNKDRFAPFIEGPFEEHLLKLKNPKEWAGQVEISALSLMYKRDFLVYQNPGIGAFNVTQNGFTEKVVLCFSHGNHYDSVYSKKFQESAAICQSVIYEMLYKDVFKLARQVDEAVDILRSSGKKPMRRDGNYGPDGMRDGRGMEGDHMGMERDGRDRFGRYHEEKRRPPLPYRVAKALDPEIYRNVEFDAWNETRKEQQQQDFLVASGMQYAPGDKCQVFLDDPKKLYDAHIQDVQPNNGLVTVFIEDLGEKHTIPIKNLKPLESVSPHRPWSPLGVRNYKNVSGYYPKYGNGVNSESGYNQQGHQQQHQQHPSFMHPLMQSDRQNPRATSPYQRGRGGGRCNHNMHNAMSQEEYEEKRALEESLALLELQERDPSSFPALPGHPVGRINTPSPVNLWDKFRKEGRKSASPIQRVNTPSPVAVFEVAERGDRHVPNSGKNHPSHQQTRENAGTPQNANQSPATPNWQSSNSTLSTSGSNACPSTANTPSPPTVPMMPTYNAPVPIGIPLYPMIIPLTDNLTGPVNASATASRDPNGYDLPLSDVSTLRYYYNLGIEYHHRLYLLQMHQWQQHQQQQQQQQSFHQTPDPNSCPMATQTQQQPAMPTSSAGNQFSSDGAICANNNMLEDDSDEGIHQRSCTPNRPTQPYYVESPANQHIPQQQPLQQAPAPVSTFFNPHANPPSIQTEPYTHMNYHPAPPPPPPGNLGTYQYPVPSQWQHAFAYGSPVKVPAVAYGQSPPVTFIPNNAPSPAPALYMPTSH